MSEKLKAAPRERATEIQFSSKELLFTLVVNRNPLTQCRAALIRYDPEKYSAQLECIEGVSRSIVEVDATATNDSFPFNGGLMKKFMVQVLALCAVLAMPLSKPNTAIASSSFIENVEAPGKVFYKMPSGEIVERKVSLQVPARGEGKVVLKWASGELPAESFSTRKENGRTIFYVRFTNVPHAPTGTVMVFKGTYSRGSNLALYYGDIFVRGSEHPEREWNYIGGFEFKAEIH